MLSPFGHPPKAAPKESQCSVLLNHSLDYFSNLRKAEEFLFQVNHLNLRIMQYFIVEVLPWQNLTKTQQLLSNSAIFVEFCEKFLPIFD